MDRDRELIFFNIGNFLFSRRTKAVALRLSSILGYAIHNREISDAVAADLIDTTSMGLLEKKGLLPTSQFLQNQPDRSQELLLKTRSTTI